MCCSTVQSVSLLIVHPIRFDDDDVILFGAESRGKICDRKRERDCRICTPRFRRSQRQIGAEEALRIGLVNAVVPHADLMTKVKDVAAKIAAKGRIAIAQSKRVIFSGEGVPLDTATALETQAFAMLFGTKDRREGMNAFLEKRSPSFTGS